jgi:hypothetical protein
VSQTAEAVDEMRCQICGQRLDHVQRFPHNVVPICAWDCVPKEAIARVFTPKRIAGHGTRVMLDRAKGTVYKKDRLTRVTPQGLHLVRGEQFAATLKRLRDNGIGVS